MLDGLKKKAAQVFGAAPAPGKGMLEIDRILALPIMGLRRELKKAYFDKKFDQAQFEDFTKRIAALGGLDDQLEIAIKAAADREVPSDLDIELNTPAKTLLWCAVLTRMMDAGDAPLVKSRLWQQLQDTIGLHNESIILAKVISSSLQNDDVTFGYGQPGSWFYYHTLDNHINMDLYFMLMSGFEHARSVSLQENGHSELSHAFSPKMQELYEKLKKYIDPRLVNAPDAELPQLSVEDQKGLAMEAKEWQLRHSLWHPTEDNCVNQFAVNMETVVPIGQNFGDGLNHISVLFQGFWALDPERLPEELTTEMPKATTQREQEMLDAMQADRAAAIERYRQMMEDFKKPLPQGAVDAVAKGDISADLARKMFRQITSITLMAFYEKNGLFPNDKKIWERFAIFQDDINKTVDVSKIPAAKGMTAFEYLRHLCVGKGGVRTQQPRPSDRFFGEEHYRRKVAETSKARGEIVDHIWDIYLDKFSHVLKQEYAQKVEEELKQQQQQQQPGQNQQDKKQQGQQEGSQGQEGQQGQPSKGQKGKNKGQDQGGQDQGGQGEAGEGQEASDQGQNSSGRNEQDKSQGQDEGDDQDGGGSPDQQKQEEGAGENKPLSERLKKGIGEMSETPQEARDKENGVDSSKRHQNKKSAKDNGKDKGGDQDASGQEAGDGQEGQGNSQGNDQGNDKGGWDQDPDQDASRQSRKRVGDAKQEAPIETEMSEEQKQAMREAAKQRRSDPNALKTSAAGSQSMELDLEELAKGSWTDFQARVNELMPVISRLAETYRQIKEAQRQEVIRLSPEHELLPEDGDFRGRLDRDKFLDMKFRQATGQPVSIDDLKKFTADRVTTMESTIEIASLIDGSGSMAGWRINAAIQSAVINYMAARMAGIDSYIIVWGDPVPKVIATPTSDLRAVGAMLEALRNNANGGTRLHYALDSIVDTMSKHQNGPETISGSSHVIVYSDGDIADAPQVSQRLSAISTSGRNVTVDVAILREDARSGQSSGTDMEIVFQAEIDKSGDRHLGIVRGTDPQEVPMEIARLILKRVQSFPVQTEPDAEKRRQLKQLHNKMQGPK